MLGLKRLTVRVVDYTDEWSSIFHKLKEELTTLLKEDNVQIEHIGSTSIDGMPAKPILDLVIGFDTLDEERIQSIIPKLDRLSFIYRGNRKDRGGYLFVKEPKENIITHHLHMVEINDDQWTHYLQFRDTLRANPELASEYKELKLGLEKKYADDRLMYTESKEQFIKKVLEGGNQS